MAFPVQGLTGSAVLAPISTSLSLGLCTVASGVTKGLPPGTRGTAGLPMTLPNSSMSCSCHRQPNISTSASTQHQQLRIVLSAQQKQQACRRTMAPAKSCDNSSNGPKDDLLSKRQGWEMVQRQQQKSTHIYLTDRPQICAHAVRAKSGTARAARWQTQGENLLRTLGSARLQVTRDTTTWMSTARDSHSGRNVARKVAICAAPDKQGQPAARSTALKSLQS